MVSAPELDQIRQFCFVEDALFDLVFIGGVQVQKMVLAAWEWSVFPMDHRFPGFRSRCSWASCGKVDPCLATVFASSLPQRLQCPGVPTMSNLLEQMIVEMDCWRVTMVGSI